MDDTEKGGAQLGVPLTGAGGLASSENSSIAALSSTILSLRLTRVACAGPRAQGQSFQNVNKERRSI